jgi:hypothetical protein
MAENTPELVPVPLPITSQLWHRMTYTPSPVYNSLSGRHTPIRAGVGALGLNPSARELERSALSRRYLRPTISVPAPRSCFRRAVARDRAVVAD